MSLFDLKRTAAPQIWWGDFHFSSPVPVYSFMRLPPPGGGVYVVMVADASCTPAPFRALYFGECERFTERLTTQHEKFSAWTREANGSALYVSIHPMTAGPAQRKALENQLMHQYNTPCNLKASAPSVLSPPTARYLPNLLPPDDPNPSPSLFASALPIPAPRPGTTNLGELMRGFGTPQPPKPLLPPSSLQGLYRNLYSAPIEPGLTSVAALMQRMGIPPKHGKE